MKKTKTKKNTLEVNYLNKATFLKRLEMVKNDIDFLYNNSNCYEYVDNVSMGSLLDDNLRMLRNVANALCSALEL